MSVYWEKRWEIQGVLGTGQVPIQFIGLDTSFFQSSPGIAHCTKIRDLFQQIMYCVMIVKKHEQALLYFYSSVPNVFFLQAPEFSG